MIDLGGGGGDVKKCIWLEWFEFRQQVVPALLFYTSFAASRFFGRQRSYFGNSALSSSEAWCCFPSFEMKKEGPSPNFQDLNLKPPEACMRIYPYIKKRRHWTLLKCFWSASDLSNRPKIFRAMLLNSCTATWQPKRGICCLRVHLLPQSRKAFLKKVL